MLRRFQIFAETLLEQANRHSLAGELIVVEWNPPPGPRLHEVLKLSQVGLFCYKIHRSPSGSASSDPQRGCDSALSDDRKMSASAVRGENLFWPPTLISCFPTTSLHLWLPISSYPM
jgi:hypothetical protein